MPECISAVWDNRETGEKPVRSRRCIEGAALKYIHCASMGRIKAVMIAESEDLPFCGYTQ